jgi:DNA-nicking Smr family endonuclease
MARKSRDPEALKKARSSTQQPATQGALSDEERALWNHVAGNLKPLKDKRQRVLVRKEEPPHERAADASQAAPAKREVARPAPPPAKDRPQRHAPPLSDLDRRKTRAIDSGKVEIEARIDLHGMRQAEAHAALRRFLVGAYGKGKRWVLVITGKGAPLDRSLNRTMTPRDDLELGDEPRGVLRRNVPRWLEEPELRTIVVGYSTAAIRHGGEGALYVQLRKLRED